MTHKELLLDCFKRHNNKVTLGTLLSEGQYTFGHKLSATISNLRKDGFNIRCEQKDIPSHNIYTLSPNSDSVIQQTEKPFTDENGNTVLTLGV